MTFIGTLFSHVRKHNAMEEPFGWYKVSLLDNHAMYVMKFLSYTRKRKKYLWD